ncbi:hypothetical protein Smp_125120.1 [Schistosoma mansoni]|uniref:hypothetical protein n=1 Tax=Schistosoma mansoni TaxID=6183 RepID=UPI00022C8702|nr:hypothetical protein Smp_125120.1 [Schistosoma mansoni]|eukprot:XP_018646615.1 hypothetical protein Smp_125120.1 [Schistosoma mansoni]
MDHLYSKLSTYELDYTDDINKKMRVPEKLSYDSDNSATLSEGHDVSFRNYPVADLILDAKRSSEYAPGYSPDILNNSDIRSKLICNAQAHASSQSADGSAKANASAGVFCETSSHRAQERLRVSKSSSTGDNEHVSIDHRLIRLEKRISHLEFQQALMKGGLTVTYFLTLIDVIIIFYYSIYPPLHLTNFVSSQYAGTIAGTIFLVFSIPLIICSGFLTSALLIIQESIQDERDYRCRDPEFYKDIPYPRQPFKPVPTTSSLPTPYPSAPVPRFEDFPKPSLPPIPYRISSPPSYHSAVTLTN